MPPLPPSYQPRNKDGTRGPNPPSFPAPATKTVAVKPLGNSTNNMQVDPQPSSDADAILKLINALPHPLSSRLPPRYLGSPDSSSAKTPTTSSSTRSFVDWIATEIGKSSPDKGPVIGLGLTFDGEKQQAEPSLSVESTVEPRKVGSPNFGVTTGLGTYRSMDPSTTKAVWPTAKWHKLGQDITDRAINAKRLGDAHGRLPSARPEFLIKTQEDKVNALLFHTDSLFLFLYSFWCQEQSHGRAQVTGYHQTLPFIKQVRKEWEEQSQEADPASDAKERTKCMLGLVGLIEGLSRYQISQDMFSRASRRYREISYPSVAHVATPSSVGSQPSVQVGPPPTPSIKSAMEVAKLQHDGQEMYNKAIESYQPGQSFLTKSRLRAYFPRMSIVTQHADMSEVLLAAPGDILASGRFLDIDEVYLFAWPIQLDMVAGIAHVCVFGRGMLAEYAGQAGRKWDLELKSELK